ncbi:MAG TPA: ABC transporter ATP-binding protein [Myxococcaceae bacterium]|nr:ABC transporter ATP-binding protein [Myxococcaceae bacterium]
MLAIEALGLRKTYNGLFARAPQEALAGVDLAVPSGSAFGLIGPNGAGKTTFIKAILGIVRWSAGSVQVMGGSPDDPEIRRRIGYLPERLQLPAAWSARGFLASVARLKSIAGAEAQVQWQLERVGLRDCRDRRIGTFSKGMRQRLGLASALLGEPELLVLDEPTDGVDPLGRVDIRQILLGERQRGATLFLNSHLLSETERVCDRIGILSRGRLVREGPLEQLCRPEGRWRVRFASPVDQRALEPLGFIRTEVPGLWQFQGADAAALNAALDRARGCGALLLELSQEGSDLEHVLAEAVEARA